jgi:hypothetical protein
MPCDLCYNINCHIREEKMSDLAKVVAIVLGLGAASGATNALAGGSKLPPSVTEPGWGKDSNYDCYQSRLVHTQNGLRWRRVWVCH